MTSALIILIILLLVAAQVATIIHAASTANLTTKRIAKLTSRIVELEVHNRQLEVSISNTNASIRMKRGISPPTVIRGDMDLIYGGRTASMQAVFKPTTYK